MRHIGTALGVSSDTLNGIVRNHLSQKYKFSRKEIGIDSSYDGSKLFTTIPGVCRVVLGSTHPDRYDVLDFLVKRHNHLQSKAWEAQKTEHAELDDSIPVAKSIYFGFKLCEPALLCSNSSLVIMFDPAFSMIFLIPSQCRTDKNDVLKMFVVFFFYQI